MEVLLYYVCYQHASNKDEFSIQGYVCSAISLRIHVLIFLLILIKGLWNKIVRAVMIMKVNVLAYFTCIDIYLVVDEVCLCGANYLLFDMRSNVIKNVFTQYK